MIRSPLKNILTQLRDRQSNRLGDLEGRVERLRAERDALLAKGGADPAGTTEQPSKNTDAVIRKEAKPALDELRYGFAQKVLTRVRDVNVPEAFFGGAASTRPNRRRY